MASNGCQFPQPAYPLTSSQLVAPTFLEPPQYLTAIPMQPVIAPFPVAPVLSPIPVQAQPDLLPDTVVMTPTQSQLQDQLQRKHDELQKLILQQQNELRIVSEQLLLSRYTYLQPMMSMGFAPGNMTAAAVGNMGAGGQRGLNFTGSNAVQPQFNQYGFALNLYESHSRYRAPTDGHKFQQPDHILHPFAARWDGESGCQCLRAGQICGLLS